MPKLIAIIISFNRYIQLEVSINKCIENNIDHIIIIDNNSNDDVINYLKGLSNNKVSVFYNDRNVGASAAFKQGVSYLKNICNLDNDIVVFLDDDAYICDSFKSKVMNIGDGYIAPRVVDLDGKILKMNQPWVKLPITLVDTIQYLFKRPIPNNIDIKQPIKVASFVGLTMKANTAYYNSKYIPKDFFIYYDDIFFTLLLTKDGLKGFYHHDIKVIHDTTDEKRINTLIRIKYLFINGVITYRKISRWWWIIMLSKLLSYSFSILIDNQSNKIIRIKQILKSIYLGYKKACE